jgi:hypothetical protein
MEIHYNRRRLKFTAATLLHPAEVNVTSPSDCVGHVCSRLQERLRYGDENKRMVNRGRSDADSG